jgi:tight adherence protein C
MPETAFVPFALRVAGFEFSPLETVLLVVCLATALLSLFELSRLSGRERLQRRVSALRGAIVDHTRPVRVQRVPWYDRVGATIAKTPLVGASEQRRLSIKLASAGLGGPGRLPTFIAVRFMFAVIGGTVAGFGIASLGFFAETAGVRYFVVAFGFIIGWRIPDVILTRLARRRKMRLEMGFPDALDLLVICAEAGLGLEQAMGQVARDLRRAIPEVAEEFAVTEAEMRVLADRRIALEHLAQRTGIASLQGMIAILNQSVRFGTPLSEALRQLTAESRMIRMAHLEERAARLSVTLLLPVMLFIMPCLFLVICGPVALRAIDMFSTFMAAP